MLNKSTGARTTYTSHPGGNLRCKYSVQLESSKRKENDVLIKPVWYNLWNVSNGMVRTILFCNQNFLVFRLNGKRPSYPKSETAWHRQQHRNTILHDALLFLRREPWQERRKFAYLMTTSNDHCTLPTPRTCIFFCFWRTSFTNTNVRWSNRPFQLVHFVFPFQTTWCPYGNFPFVFSLVMRKFARA